MKTPILVGAALLTLGSGSVMAADMRPAPAPVYTKAPMMAPSFSWSGCYIGGNVGGLWAKKDWTTSAAVAVPGFVAVGAGAANSSQDVNSWLAGAQVGCNYQVAAWVFGVQGDYDWTNGEGTSSSLAFVGLRDHSSIKSLASVTGRLGYAWDRFLGYVKGGYAWERDNYDASNIGTGVAFATASETRGGWTLGVGGEYAFTDWLTGFAEYDYYNFGTRTNSFGTIFAAVPVVQVDIRERKSVAKIGLNIKFGGSGSVMSRY